MERSEIEISCIISYNLFYSHASYLLLGINFSLFFVMLSRSFETLVTRGSMAQNVTDIQTNFLFRNNTTSYKSQETPTHYEQAS
jgi:hypothetical protein